MCQYSSEDGFASDWHLVNAGSRAVGGAGIVILEASAVTADGRISPQDLGIWKDDHIAGLGKIAKFVRSQGAAAGIQLAHAGRKASMPRPWDVRRTAVPESEGGWSRVLAPSAIPFGAGYVAPSAMSIHEIEIVIEAFGDAAQRALDAGFDVIELHSAHGYLIHEFLSPISNHRTDDFGGSFEDRTRFIRYIVTTIREVWPKTHPLFVRLSASDWTPGGWDIEQTVKLAVELRALGADLIDCSSGGNVEGAKIPVGPGYQVPFAAAVKKAGILPAAVGMIAEPEQANEIIESGQADLILLAREFLRDPYWPLHAAKTLGIDVAWPDQYARAKL